jgi:hypothetical protein
MVATVQVFLELIESAIPELYRSFSCLSLARGETNTINNIYDRIDETNFSHQVLSLRPERLAVLKVIGVRWNHLGEPKRVMASLNSAGIRPHWAEVGMPQFALVSSHHARSLRFLPSDFCPLVFEF